MSLSTRLRQERHHIVTQLMAPLAGKTDAVSRAEWKRLDQEQKALEVRIQTAETNDTIGDLNRVSRDPQYPEINTDPYANRGGPLTPFQRREQIRSSESYKQDFERWLRTGRQTGQLASLAMDPEQRATLTEGADVSGGTASTLVPTGFEYELEIKLKAIGGMRRVCRGLKTATGQNLPWPTMDDTSNIGEWLAEGSQTTQNVNPTFSNVVLYANLASSKQVQVSVQLEQDSAFDLPALLSDAFAIRIARLTENAFVNGGGSQGSPAAANGTPNGLLYAIEGNGNQYLALGANANTGNSAQTEINSIGSSDLANLISNLDPMYRPTAKFMAHQSTWDNLRTLLDKYGRPLWEVSLAAGVPDSILGYKYDYSQYFPTIAASAVGVVVFGDFSKYIIRSVLGLTLVRFNETYMQNYNRGYQAFLREDGNCIQTAAFSYLSMRAS
jgi:HK97 family phage major capsid protein